LPALLGHLEPQGSLVVGRFLLLLDQEVGVGQESLIFELVVLKPVIAALDGGVHGLHPRECHVLLER